MVAIEIKYIHRVYANVIIDGGRTFASVPEQDKGAVKLALQEKGYEIGANGGVVTNQAPTA